MTAAPRCLLVDDEPKSAQVFAKTVDSLGHACDQATTQKQALEFLRNGRGKKYSYVLLDLKLKVDDDDHDPDSCVGLTLLSRIRETYPKDSLPILVMTAYENDVETAVEVMKRGATDFVLKDCASKVRLERITGLVRQESVVVHPDGNDRAVKTKFTLEIDGNRPNVMSYNGQKIDLSKTQYQFMLYMAARPGLELTTDVIITGVWGDNGPEDQRINSIRNEINKKLKKVDRRFKGSEFIKNIRASGWKLNVPPSKVHYKELIRALTS